MLEYLSAFDEEAVQVCSLDAPGPLTLPLVEEEEAVSEAEACEDSEVADDSLGEGTVCTELSQEEAITKPGFPQLSSSPCYYFYQGESRGRGWGCLRAVEGGGWPSTLNRAGVSLLGPGGWPAASRNVRTSWERSILRAGRGLCDRALVFSGRWTAHVPAPCQRALPCTGVRQPGAEPREDLSNRGRDCWVFHV